MSNDTKQHASVNADVLKRLYRMDAFSENHDEQWKNKVAADLNYLVNGSRIWDETLGPEFLAAVLRTIERVAEFEKIETVKRKTE